MKYFITAIMVLASMAMVAAQGAPRNANSRGLTFEMCDAKSATGTCDNAAGIDVYALVEEYSQFTVFFSQDTGTLRTCELYCGDQDTFNNIGATLTASDGTKLNSTSFSSSSTAQSFEAPFFFMFVICANGTGTHSVLIQAAK